MARTKAALATALAASAAFVGRQGDVAILRVSALPGSDRKERKRDRGRVILAYGEVTGHAHAIADKKVIHFDTDDAVEAANHLLASIGVDARLSEHNAPSFLAVEEAATVEHDEHAPIALDPGNYLAVRQREWSDAEEPIQVAD